MTALHVNGQLKDINHQTLKKCPDDWLAFFLSTYQALNKHNLHTLSDIYHQDVIFCDPLHKVNGLNALTEYFSNLYENVESINFKINKSLVNGPEAAIYWQMQYSHKKLNSGNTITVEGHSLLVTQSGKVNNHRDYIDMGAMLYEHIPLLGYLVKTVKKRATS